MAGHVCPWWLGYSFDNPLRRVVHDPARILDGLVEPGHTVVDIGCGSGFFTLAMARIVGDEGRVIALDVQRQMLDRTRRRAERRGLARRVEFHMAGRDRLGLTQTVDFALAFWMVHEVPDRDAFLAEVDSILKPDAHLLLAEPKVHVSARSYAETIDIARGAGFDMIEERAVRFSRAAVLGKSNPKAHPHS